MTRAEFVSSEHLRAQLHALLNHDVFKLAAFILTSDPPTFPSEIPGVNYGDQVAVAGARHIGYLEFYKNLKLMTQEPKNKASAPSRQLDMFADAAKAQMVESGIYKEAELKDL